MVPGLLHRDAHRDVLSACLSSGDEDVRSRMQRLIGQAARQDDVQELDDGAVEELRACALVIVERVRALHATGRYQRGVECHDRLMRALLATDAHERRAEVADVNHLLQMLEVGEADLDDSDFVDGFTWASRSLCDELVRQLDPEPPVAPGR